MDEKHRLLIGPLKTRETPRQKRAQERVHKILHAAADVLIDTPPYEVSTTMIAAQAEIPVSSVYRYFPKLSDLFSELYMQSSVELEQRIFDLFERSEGDSGWRDRHRSVHDTFRRFRVEHPYYLALLQSQISRTGLKTIDLQKPMSISDFLAARWAKGGDGFRGGDPVIVSHITMQTFLAIEGFLATQIDPSDADRYFDELSVNLESYLANYLSDDR